MSQSVNDNQEAEKLIQKPKMWGPVAGLLGGLGIYLGAQILTGIVIQLLASSSGSDFDEYIDNNEIFVSFIGSILLGGLTVWLVYLATKKFGGLERLKLLWSQFKPSYLWTVVMAFGAYFLLSMILFFVAENWVQQIDLDQEQDVGFSSVTVSWQYIMAFISLVVIAPISEEVLFRGYTYQGLRSSMPWWLAAGISSALFGLAHFQLNVALDTFALGFVACWLLEKTNSLWSPIILHATKNLIAFIVLFVV